jgi:hypothetical protein
MQSSNYTVVGQVARLYQDPFFYNYSGVVIMPSEVQHSRLDFVARES